MFAFQGVMVPMRGAVVGAVLAALCALPAQAATERVVQCRSHDYGYTECPAHGLKQPQLIYQISSSACIVNRTWGFDRTRGLLWVDDGCAGRFADVGGYHHGRTGLFDPGARRYTAHGEDAGPFVGGQALGALFEGASSTAGGGVASAPPAAAAPAPAKPEPDANADRSEPAAATPAAAPAPGATGSVAATPAGHPPVNQNKDANQEGQ